MSERRRIVAVCARMGDPLFQPARARLIWAAQTAQAVNDLGAQALLVGSGRGLPIKHEGPEGVKVLKRLVADMYNVAGTFSIMPLYSPPPKEGGQYGQHEAYNLFPLYVQPYVDLVHTRDPRVVANCIKSQIPVIYEDHNEDYHLAADALDLDLNNPMVVAVVAITRSVADRLVLMGTNRARIIIQDSGVNARALDRKPIRAAAWRKSLLRDGRQERLAVYTGGMQIERGIAHIMNAALRMTDVMFAMAGGNSKDIAYWVKQAKAKNLTNVQFLGYLPQNQVIELQQAADVVLMTRESGARSTITSPLKFFEYLASGTPILSARTTVLQEKDTNELSVGWYNAETQDSIISALRHIFATYPFKIEGYAENIAFSRIYTWQERQKKIIAFANINYFISGSGE